MSARILKGQSAGVRPFLVAAEPSESRPDAGVAERSPMVALMEKLALCEAEIEKHEAALAEAYANGEAAGRVAAEEEFVDDRAKALANLTQGIAAANAGFAEALQRFDTLALEAAHEALQALVGDHGHYRELLGSAIAAQAKALEANFVQTVTVSRADFPDSSETRALAADLAMPDAAIAVSDTLDAGKCVFQLRLGAVEFDFGWRWSQISDILTSNPLRGGAPE